MTKIFNGIQFASEKEKLLKRRVEELSSKGITPHLASLIIGDDKASLLYQHLKKAAAQRVGADVEVFVFPATLEGITQAKEKIESLNEDSKYQGIMIQLPLPKELKEFTSELIELINPKKDVDGLKQNSKFLPATVKAICSILGLATLDNEKSILIVGSEGEVGKRLLQELRRKGFMVEGVDKETKDLKSKTMDADVLICATGVKQIIKKDFVKEGAVVIDVGAPFGEVDFDHMSEVASFITPVPGGVGPVTVISLIENLVDASEASISS